jgi:hypothetical protein
LNLRFIEHVGMAPLTFDDIEFTGYYTAPAELPIKVLADRAEATSKEHNPTIVWFWLVPHAHEMHVGELPEQWRKNWIVVRASHVLLVREYHAFLNRSRK